MPLVYKYQVALKLIDDIKDIDGVDDGLLTFFLVFDAPGNEFGVDTSEVITHIWQLINYKDFKEMRQTTMEMDIKTGEIKQNEDCYFVFRWFGEFKTKAVLLIEEETLLDYIKLLIDENPNSPTVNVDALKRTRIINQMNPPPIETGKWTWWYENGQKKEEGTYNRGERDGKWTLWHDNGQKLREGIFKDGKLDGEWTAWYENGQKEEELNYRDGEKDGRWIAWYENGQKEVEATWKNGTIVDGLVTSYYENGQKWKEETYKNGEFIEATWWDEDGNVIGF